MLGLEWDTAKDVDVIIPSSVGMCDAVKTIASILSSILRDSIPNKT